MGIGTTIFRMGGAYKGNKIADKFVNFLETSGRNKAEKKEFIQEFINIFGQKQTLNIKNDLAFFEKIKQLNGKVPNLPDGFIGDDFVRIFKTSTLLSDHAMNYRGNYHKAKNIFFQKSLLDYKNSLGISIRPKDRFSLFKNIEGAAKSASDNILGKGFQIPHFA